MQPIYAGDNRVFCELPTGERLCVDGKTLDAISYLFGEPIEPHVAPLFRKFLMPGSVVLDVGANFGFYSVIAAKVLGPRGRLFAFEPHPDLFGLLRRSIWANKFQDPDNVVLVNALVGDRTGAGRLYYDPEELAGASLTAGDRRSRSVEVPMLAIDDYLPAHLPVDLVKIDVEGHEPAVLRGMRQTLARSPNIRLFIEFFEHLLAAAGYDRQRFIAEIRCLGFEICIIREGGKLDFVEAGDDIRGQHYLMLTRTASADMARDYFVVAMESMK
jgi:FkbM family methyltransferase